MFNVCGEVIRPQIHISTSAVFTFHSHIDIREAIRLDFICSPKQGVDTIFLVDRMLSRHQVKEPSCAHFFFSASAGADFHEPKFTCLDVGAVFGCKL